MPFAFPDFATPVKNVVNTALRALVDKSGDTLDAVAAGLIAPVLWLERSLADLPPPLVILVFAALALAATRRWLAGLAVLLGLFAVGSFGLWPQAIQSIAMVLFAVAICGTLGLALGVLGQRSRRTRSVLLPVLDLMQTVPSFVYLIPAVMVFGLGRFPALVATIIYALPPMVRLTMLGLEQIDKDVIDAAKLCGADRSEILRHIELPLAGPSILQGLNQTVMMALGMVVVSAMIGARGLGETVLVGLQRGDAGLGLIGGVAIVIIAILLDRTIQSAGRRHMAWRAPTR